MYDAESGTCYAPVFQGTRNAWVCTWLTIIYATVIMLLIIGTLGLILLFPQGRCVIKGYVFRIRRCMEGNSDPEIEI